MDAVEKATEALFRLHTNADLIHWDTRQRVARTILDAVGYDALRAERDRLREALDQVADTFNAHDAVTDSDVELYAEKPGEALSRAVASILSDLNSMIEAAHCEARRALNAEAERNAYRAMLGFIAENAASAHHARYHARAALDREPQ